MDKVIWRLLEREVKVSGCLSSRGQGPLEEQEIGGQDHLEVLDDKVKILLRSLEVG